MRKKLGFTFAAIFLGLVLAFGSSVKAEDSSVSAEPTESPRVSGTPGPKAPETPEPSETPRVRGFDRLEGKRLQFCENHQEEVANRLSSLGDLVANMLGKFDAIVTRVEQFYTGKVLPSGKTVPNYDALVADIAAKRALAVKALTNAQKDINGFTCKADNPKGQITLFRTDMQNVKKALKDYRTSIKNLIVAVKSVVGENESPKPSHSPEASESGRTQ